MRLMQLLVICFFSLSFLISCKKNEHADQLIGEKTNTPLSLSSLTTLQISESTHDFGTISKGTSVEHIYEVTNTGTAPLVISEVKPTCGCTVPEYTKEPIAPGAKGKIALKFDSSNFEGMVTKSAQVFTNTKEGVMTLNFRANIVKTNF